MAKTRMALELGMGTSLRAGDYTRAAVRAVEDAGTRGGNGHARERCVAVRAVTVPPHAP